MVLSRASTADDRQVTADERVEILAATFLAHGLPVHRARCLDLVVISGFLPQGHTQNPMLQIISGKFFAPEAEIHESPSTAVLYSNARLYMPFESAVGVLAPTQRDGPYYQYVFEYVQRMEKTTGKVSLVKADDSPAVLQFANLLTVGMGAYFATDLASVQRHCTPIQSGGSLVRRHLDHSILVEPETLESSRVFISDCLALNRRGFLTVSNCVAAISDALESLHTNVDLAYSLLVFGAECLSQRHDGYVADWSHYPKQPQLDAHLSQVPGEVAEAIRQELLSENQFKLTQRFIDFLCSLLRTEFFTTEARGLPQALRQSEVRAALAKVYNARSKYAHELQQIQHQLKVPQIAAGDVFHWYNEPYLTFNGLLRLVAHSLHTFVINEQKVEHEDYNWREDLPGIVKLFMAPQYGIFNQTTVTSDASWQRLEGFLSTLCTLWAENENNMRDFRPVLERFARFITSLLSTTSGSSCFCFGCGTDFSRRILCRHQPANCLMSIGICLTSA